MRSLFSLSPREYAVQVGTKLSRALALDAPAGPDDLERWHGGLELWAESTLRHVISAAAPQSLSDSRLLDESEAASSARKRLPSELKNYADMLHRRLLTLRRDVTAQRSRTTQTELFAFPATSSVTE